MKKKIFIFFAALSIGMVSFTLYSWRGKEDHANHKEVKEKKQMYHCPMHPNYTSDRPGDCPICGMKLVPIEKAEHEAEVEDKESKEERSREGIKGQAAIKIGVEKEQMIGVKTGEVTVRELKKIIRAPAKVAYDPDLYNAISEYQAALSAKEKTKESAWPEVRERAESLVNASELRLKQMGLPENEIKKIGDEKSNRSNLILPEKGEKVWIYASIYDVESSLVKEGQTMEVSAQAILGKKFFGAVRAVDPIFNKESRSLRVRAEVENREGFLRPEMYVNAKIIVNLGAKLSVPEEAVLNTGEKQIVFVALGKGKYEPRAVQLGQEAEGYYELISGVEEGEEVVTSANFLIDSESKLKAATANMGGGHSH